MSTKVKFGNKIIQLPGTYSRIVSGQNNPPRDLDYGKLLIIDNDDLNSSHTGNGILGGAGINGTLASGKDAIYTLRDIKEFKDFVGYGWWYKAAEFLFNPDGRGNGVSEVIVVKPATTTPAVMTFTATGGGAAGGTFKVNTRDESAAANGSSTSALTSGYGFSITTGVIDSSKWIFKIFRGTNQGNYTDGLPYEGSIGVSSVPVLVAQSPEFNNIADLISWANTDPNFGRYFVLDNTSAVVGTGVVTSADITPLTAYVLASGGSATYDSLDDVFDFIKDLNYNYILTTCSTANSSSDTDILKIVDHITNDAKYDKFLIIAGDDDDIETTIGYAETFDSSKVNIVHGAIKKVSNITSSGFRVWESFFHAAYYAGRILGLAPEVPLTFKDINIDGVVAPLTEKQKLMADSAGVLVTYFDDDFGRFVNLHDVNTLQDSDFVLTNQGESHLIQIERIKAQLNKELIINSKLDLMSNPVGLNRFTLTEEDAVEWTKIYLERKVGTLLVDWRNVTAQTIEDNIFVDYEASPNSEIKGIFFTGRLYL